MKKNNQEKLNQENLNSQFKVEKPDLIVERYKFILEEIKYLNSNSNKYLSLFQTLTTAIIGGKIYVFMNWKSLGISKVAAQSTIRGLYFMLIILAIFIMISFINSIISWFDYRREEVELLNESLEKNFRELPQLKNFWRWGETPIIIFILIVVFLIGWFIECKLIPLM